MQSLRSKYKKALITGGSSGLGKAFVDSLLSQGLEVWATSRYPDRQFQHERLHWLKLDLLNSDTVKSFASQLLSAVPDIDLVINSGRPINRLIGRSDRPV